MRSMTFPASIQANYWPWFSYICTSSLKPTACKPEIMRDKAHSLSDPGPMRPRLCQYTTHIWRRQINTIRNSLLARLF